MIKISAILGVCSLGYLFIVYFIQIIEYISYYSQTVPEKFVTIGYSLSMAEYHQAIYFRVYNIKSLWLWRNATMAINASLLNLSTWAADLLTVFGTN